MITGSTYVYTVVLEKGARRDRYRSGTYSFGATIKTCKRIKQMLRICPISDISADNSDEPVSDRPFAGAAL